MFQCLIGWIKGSLAVVTVLASALFGAISGSGCCNGICGWRHNHSCHEGGRLSRPFRSGDFRIAAILGPIIPPSITLIVYASITDLSVSKLFVGSVIPGILMAVGLIIYALFYGKKNDLPAHERKICKRGSAYFQRQYLGSADARIILGGIFGGIFTPTESAAVAVVYALLVSLLIYKDIKIKDIPGIFVDGAISTATILMLVGISKSSGYVITTSVCLIRFWRYSAPLPIVQLSFCCC